MSRIRALQQKLLGGELSATELTQAYLDAIERDGPALAAYVSTTPALALEAAAKTDAKLRAGEPLAPLEGVPMALKDNICTAGVRTTCASRMLDDYVPVYDATVWARLRGQNAPLLGKCNMDEFAMGSTCETSYIGGAKNPHDLTRVAGGSSGGSAAAVAGGLAAWTLGSDTGGSIRQPASFCGLVGLKPTYGAVSRYGLVAFASSLDQIGPLASCVEDAALVFDEIARPDARDMTCHGAKEAAVPRLHEGVRGRRIGIADEFFDGAQPEVARAVHEAAKLLEAEGAQLVQVRFPRLRYALPVYYILACAEASSNLSRYDGIRYGYAAAPDGGLDAQICRGRSEAFGAEVKRRILLGTFVLSSGYFDAYYNKARLLQASLQRELEREVFAHCDMLLTPTVPVTALRGGQALNPVETYLTDICTVSANIAGLPALSVPCGRDGAGLPIGMQLIGRRFADAELLAAGYAFEQASAGSYLTALEMGCRL